MAKDQEEYEDQIENHTNKIRTLQEKIKLLEEGFLEDAQIKMRDEFKSLILNNLDSISNSLKQLYITEKVRDVENTQKGIMRNRFGQLHDMFLTDMRELSKIAASSFEMIIKRSKEMNITQNELIIKMKDTQK